jgi:hypothetical protein
MSKPLKGTVTYGGIEFEVEGEYLPYTPARITADPYYSEPPDGGYFEEFDVLIGGNSIFEMLTEATVEKIEELACELAEESN